MGSDLHEACEMADMRVCRLGGDAWCVEVSQGLRLYPDRALERPWIESRCADLLVGKVREIRPEMRILINGPMLNGKYRATFHKDPGGYDVDESADALAETVITAALAVLKGVGNG